MKRRFTSRDLSIRKSDSQTSVAIRSGILIPLGLVLSMVTPAWGETFGKRAFHSAVWTGSEMIVWGGTATGPTYYNDGARYNPVTGSWTATVTNGAPAPRAVHVGLWTGGDMLAWGGIGPAGLVTNHGRYNLAAGAWSVVTTSGGPSPRYYHAGVWTGSEMIVWGGNNGSYLNDGGRYNPSSGTWAALPSAGLTARLLPTAVWTGSDMIIWGGTSNSVYYGNGGRYNPSGNSWTPTSSTGAPAGRSQHTAVWTGTEMIVWGGYGGANLNDGGRYNPQNNTWTSVSTAGAPSARNFHTAVWTGTEMIIWGGASTGGYRRDGGRYNPANNTWTSINTNGSPSPRGIHTAVWTGSEMIVWGGYSGSPYYDDGGRYNPATDTWTPVPAAPACRADFPDDFACRVALSGTNISFFASNVGASVEQGEPSHFFDNTHQLTIPEADASLWYSWTAPFSGGVVITAASTDPVNFYVPCLAVYTGTVISNLTQIATNLTSYGLSRAAFNAVQGSKYVFAVAGSPYAGSTDAGGMNINLTLTPPPGNDAFTNRTPVPSLFYETSGSLVGASREPGEPTHTNSLDFALGPQSVWWTWTAPADLGVSVVPVKIAADGVGFSPSLAVYTGTVVSNLTNVSVTAESGGFTTRVVSFLASPGQTYQIALAGPQHDPRIGVPPFGTYHLRLNVRALVLTASSINWTNDFNDYSRPFGATLQVTNRGSADSAALRVRVRAVLGSVLAGGSIPATNPEVLLLTTNLTALAPGQGLARRINARVPPPIFDSNGAETGYAVYADLQEQGDADWSTVDQTFLLLGLQSTSIASGGGVVRLDPSLTGTTFNPLTNVSILGPLSVNEGSTPAYSGRARFANGFQYDFTNTVWTASRFTITNGLFKSGAVTSNTPVSLTAKYISSGFTYTAATNMVVLDLPPPVLTGSLGLTNGKYFFSIQGVPGRQHVIEAATNLGPTASWISLTTNSTSPGGLLNFLDPTVTNFSRRFYRGREF